MTVQTEETINNRTLSEGAWLINRVDVNYAAQRLEISANWDEEREFQLIFTRFHIIYWQTFEDDYDPGTFSVDVIGMEIGERDHRRPAVLTTDQFELSVSYGELEIQKAW